jgi:hypothetical protein
VKTILLISQTRLNCLFFSALLSTVFLSLHATGQDLSAFKDGKNDAAAAIQQAVDSGAGDIHFPKGIYRLEKTISIDLDKVGPTSISGNGTARIVMAGAGPAFRFIGTHEGTASPKTVKENVWERQRTPMVDGIEIVGAHPEAVGIEATGTMQLTVTRTSVRRALHGIHLVKRNRNVIISACHIYQNRGMGIFLDQLNLHQINVVNCHISYNEGGGIVVRDTELRNLQIGSCDIEGNMGGPDSKPSANIEIDSTGINGGEVEIVGCTIQHSHEAPGSTNILIESKSLKRPFTDEQKDGNITISGNVLSDAQTNIDIRNTRGLTVTGNTMWKGYTYNLLVRGCENFIVSNNVFDKNPRYGYGDGNEAKLAVRFEDCDGAVISGNHQRGVGDIPAAFVIRNSRQINLTDCNILDFGKVGLLLEKVSDSRVSGCMIRENRKEEKAQAVALRLKGGKGNMVVNNLLGDQSDIESAAAHVEGNVHSLEK